MPQASELHDEESDYTGWLTREPSSMPALALAAAAGAWLAGDGQRAMKLAMLGGKRSKIDTNGESGRRSDGLWFH